jgi:hypothetical protein
MNTLAATIAIYGSGRHACSRQQFSAPLVHDVQSVRFCRGDSLLHFNTRVGSGSSPRASASDFAENSAPDVKAPIGTASVAGYRLPVCATPGTTFTVPCARSSRCPVWPDLGQSNFPSRNANTKLDGARSTVAGVDATTIAAGNSIGRTQPLIDRNHRSC